MLETPIFALAAALLGLLLGSFINALSFRFNTGRSIFWTRSTSLRAAHSTSLRASRSRCMHCGHSLAALDLVPVLSYLWLRGRCRYCSARLSYQYPLVELAAGALALLVFLAHPPLSGLESIALFVLWLLVWMTLLFVVVYDLRHKVIPHSCSGLLVVLALLLLLLEGRGDTATLLAGPSLAAPLLLISLLSRGRAMGWGDGVLQLPLGWLLGFTAGLSGLVMAFWAGAVVGIALILGKKGLTMKSEVPFAPFLALGALIAHFFHVDFFSTLPYLW
jgi:leader peptidase (prepilin peptidase)/N-methyltransferase